MVIYSVMQPFQNWTQLILFPGLLSLTIKWAWNLWWFPLANQTGPIAVSIREETAARPVLCGIKTLLLTAQLSSVELQLHPSHSVSYASAMLLGLTPSAPAAKKKCAFLKSMSVPEEACHTI